MIELDRSDGEIRIRLPSDFYSLDEIGNCSGGLEPKVDLLLSQDSDHTTVRIRAMEGNVDDAARSLFAELNGFPSFTDVDTDQFRNAERPAVSCIILLTANDIFVKHGLIPSIIQNSAGWDIEILIVHNGLLADLGQFGNLEVVASEFGHVSKAYNAGAETANGEYLAIFHDDCIVADPHWIDKSFTRSLAGTGVGLGIGVC